MTISLKNAENAARLTGLNRPGPIHVRDRDELIVATVRLAEFMDRMDAMDAVPIEDLHPLPSLKPKI